MTNLEYVIMRQRYVLIETAGWRPLTAEEKQFLKRTRALAERLAAREKS